MKKKNWYWNMTEWITQYKWKNDSANERNFTYIVLKVWQQTLLFYWTFVKVNFTWNFTNSNFSGIQQNFRQNYKISDGIISVGIEIDMYPSQQPFLRCKPRYFEEITNFICIIFTDNISLSEKKKQKNRDKCILMFKVKL